MAPLRTTAGCLTLLMMMLSLAPFAQAQVVAPDAPPSSLPVADGGTVIEASNGITWDQASHTYTAEGGVVVRSRGQLLSADRLVAHYDPAKSDQIQLLEAIGNVQLQRGTQKATGDLGHFRLLEGTARLTGQHLRVEQGDITVTAETALEFDQNLHQAVAIGGVVMTRAASRLLADRVELYLSKDAALDPSKPVATPKPTPTNPDSAPPDSANGLEKLIAIGRVSIITPTDVARGDRAVYDPVSQIAVLEGRVRLSRDKTELVGAKVEMNMQSGVSKLLPSAGMRVYGVFGDNPAGSTSAPKPASPPQKALP
jgi:lipopolysaccharide export system protein LptA